MLYVNGVPLAVRQRITAGAKVRGLSVAAYVVKLVELHDHMLDLAAAGDQTSALDAVALSPVSR